MKQVRWTQVSACDEAEIQSLAADLGIEPLLCSMLLRRGVRSREEAIRFFRPTLEDLHDPFRMADMDRAVRRLDHAIQTGERILVYGDYDVDGTTAVALVYDFLSGLGAVCDFYVPDRFEEGYGFSMRAVEWAAEQGFGLIITLDCGIKDAARITAAAEKGMDVIVCDHHQPGELPPAYAILDPKRPDCSYPDKGLSGCGVGFKLLQGYCRWRNGDEQRLMEHLDLLAISIGADIVPLTGENRVLARFGLKRLETSPRPGVAALLEVAGWKRSRMTISDVVFTLAPRINAAGRIMSGRNAVQLLIARNREEAMEYARVLDENNRTRKDLDRDITASARAIVESDPFYRDAFSLVVRSEDWSKGVIGIVASRLVETYYKPAIVLTRKEGHLAGSARSVPGLDLYEALGRCQDLLEQFGGHVMAAGLSLREDRFEAFRARFDEVVRELLGGEQPVPERMYEEELNLHEITPELFRRMELFAPFGPDNMRPHFITRHVEDAGYSRAVGETGTHLKLHVRQRGHRAVFNGIAFDRAEDWAGILEASRRGGPPVDLLYALEENEFNGQRSIQLMVRDIRLSEPSREPQRDHQGAWEA